MKKTLNLAHRGFSGKYPENTRAAFEAAVRVRGCDGFESDVQLSADGEPVIIHDTALARTTTGKGVVGEYTFAQLRKLDCGAWFGPAFAGQQMLHLDELLQIVADSGLVLNLEIKNYDVFYKDIEEIVIGRIRAAGLASRVFLSSFNHPSMAKCRTIAPEIEAGLLYGYPLLDMEQIAVKYNINALHPQYSCLMLQPQLATLAHAAGKKINTWTVNTPEDMRFCLAKKANSIITNYPDLLAEVIKSHLKGEKE